jgi:antitoxin ParD1/3/4
VAEDGTPGTVSKYARDLIRRAHADAEAFVRLKAELARAFAAPDRDYKPLDADTVIKRNVRKAE